MPRYKLTLEYDGTSFSGWQRQKDRGSIQQVVEEAIFGFCQHETTVVAAGRTDAGVHALAQVIHADLPKTYPAGTVRDGLNHHLRPHPVAVIKAEAVGDDFHARFSALGRAYLYRIVCRRPPLVLERDRVWRVPVDLDHRAMIEGAAYLLGKHDFTSFRASLCQANSPIKTLDRLDITRDGDEIQIRAAARSFLHHQVRNMVGTLRLVGNGLWAPADVKRALDARDRKAAGPTAPAAGLYFTHVSY